MIRTNLIFVGLLLLLALPASAGTFYQWTDSSGALAVSDDIKRIPEAYRATAIKRNFETLQATAKMTRVVLPVAERRAKLAAEIDRLHSQIERFDVATAETCEGPMTVGQVRESYRERGNSYNSLFYVVRDACGRVVSKTRENPVPVLRIPE